MPRIMRSGRARISLTRPRAMAESDRSGLWYSLDDLRPQMQWAGNKLIDTGLRVGPDELDVPQPQFRTPILPADPYPRYNPRPSPNTTPVPVTVGAPLPTSPENQGFTVYTLGIVQPQVQSGGGPSPPPPPPPPTQPPSLDFSKPGNSQYLGIVS